MNVLQTPDDSTAVVRIMGEFDDFLSHNNSRGFADLRSRLTFDDTPSRLPKSSSSSSLNPSKNAPDFTFMKKPGRSAKVNRDREKNVQMIKDRTKIAQLESQLCSSERDKKRARIEFERETSIHKNVLLRQEERHEDLQRSLQYVVNQEKSVKEELKETKKEYDSYRSKSEQKIQNLQREKLKLSAELDELKEKAGLQLSKLKNELTRIESEKIVFQNDVEESRIQYENLKRQWTEAAKDLPALEQWRARASAAEHKVKELEEKLERQDEAAKIAAAMQVQLTKYKELGKENAKLQEDNNYYRETNENNLLLKEMCESMKSKLKRAEQKIVDMARLEIENEELVKKIKKWETEDISGMKKLKSPVELTQEIARLQKSEIVLREQQSELKSSARIHKLACETAQEELDLVKQQLEALKVSSSRQEELNQRLQRRLLMVTEERDGFRRILGAFDNNLSSDYDPQLRARLEELFYVDKSKLRKLILPRGRREVEGKLDKCHKHIETLESELNDASKEIHKHKYDYKQLEATFKEKEKGSRHVKEENLCELRNEVEKLAKENQELREKLETYDLYKDHMAMQGYYDPSRTKVVHFSMNPHAVAMQQRSEELQKLQKENQTLRERIKLLEEGKIKEGAPPIQWSPDSVPSAESQVKDIKVQLSNAELKNQRLKEVFTKSIQDFREACYSLTGFKIDVVRDNHYRLSSMYAECSEDHLLFQGNSKGEMNLLETPYCSQLQDYIKTYLNNGHSIPAFLASVTMDLFSRQTQAIRIN